MVKAVDPDTRPAGTKPPPTASNTNIHLPRIPRREVAHMDAFRPESPAHAFCYADFCSSQARIWGARDPPYHILSKGLPIVSIALPPGKGPAEQLLCSPEGACHHPKNRAGGTTAGDHSRTPPSQSQPQEGGLFMAHRVTLPSSPGAGFLSPLSCQ